ncbi:MAG: alginate export family protein [Pseudomonadota bacterium]
MFSAVLVALIGASDPQIDIRPRTPGTAQAPAARPLLPQDEDWSFAGEEVWAFKYENLTSDGTITASIGIDARLHAEYFDNEAFGALPGTDESVFLLATPWASITFNDRVRFYGALKHASVQGRNGPKPGAISDTLDLHQGFVEVALGNAFGQSHKDLLIRAGRQELHYGRGRVLAVRGGRFIRDDYDGGLIRYRKGDWVTDMFGVVAVEDGRDAFDNRTDDSLNLSGIYSSGVVRGTNIDLYGFRWEREEALSSPILSDVVRHYAGARLYGAAKDGWSWELEGTVLFGTVDATDEDIRGFQLAGRVAKSLPDLPGSPTPTLEFLYSTGDDDPTDGKIDTFLVPAASGLVYEDVTQPLGPGNLAWLKASAPVQIGNRLSMTPFVHAFWRVEREDALYTLFNTQLLPADTGDSDFVGAEIGATARLRLTDRLSMIAYGGYFASGGVFNGTGRNATGSSGMLGFSYRY